ncbi:MAG: Sorbitol-6-phosphate 2-dehydrogenase [Sodalis sp.]|nr:MAG: Sorbitol-6-phosphate 2-dehydrogenase [Sodalis sp.]
MIRDKTAGRIIQINSKSWKVGSKLGAGFDRTWHYGVVWQSTEIAVFQSLLPQYAERLGIPVEQVEHHYIDKVPLNRVVTIRTS